MEQIDSGEEVDRRATRSSRPASSSVAACARPIPKGLLIGQVIDVRRDANDVVQTAYLQPAADLDKLEYVLVITRLRGRPAADRAAAGRLHRPGDGTLPEGEQPCLIHAAPEAIRRPANVHGPGRRPA